MPVLSESGLEKRAQETAEKEKDGGVEMSIVKRRQAKGFGVMTAKGSILASNGEYYKPMFIGPGAYSAKVWKTLDGARKRATQIHGVVFRI